MYTCGPADIARRKAEDTSTGHNIHISEYLYILKFYCNTEL